MYAMWVKK